MFFLKRRHFSKHLIIKGLIAAILFSSSLYLSYFDIEIKIINTNLAILSLYSLLVIPRVSLFYVGCLIGIFWFYWVSFSFIYYDFAYLIPLIILIFSIFYGFLFLSIAIIDNKYTRTFMIFLISFVEPFGFNWLKIELLFVNSYLDTSKISLVLILLSVLLLFYKKWVLFTLPVLISYFMQNQSNVVKSDMRISLPEYSFTQDYKWNRKNLQDVIDENFKQIDLAIENGYEIVVLPETSFPLVLNTNKVLLDKLYSKSQYITIIAGALFYENKEHKNSSYIFNKGRLQIAHKVVLVPFGETIPFPDIIKDFINNVIYTGASDYTKASMVSNIQIKDTYFRSAICYEATTDTIYQNLNGIKYVIAISNNAWFTPSIEPTLQKLMMKYYSKKYDVIIYNSINGSKNKIITPD